MIYVCIYKISLSISLSIYIYIYPPTPPRVLQACEVSSVVMLLIFLFVCLPYAFSGFMLLMSGVFGSIYSLPPPYDSLPTAQIRRILGGGGLSKVLKRVSMRFSNFQRTMISSETSIKKALWDTWKRDRQPFQKFNGRHEACKYALAALQTCSRPRKNPP